MSDSDSGTTVGTVEQTETSVMQSPGEQTGVQSGGFESWYGALDEGSRKLVDGHIVKLKSALESERGQVAKLKSSLSEAQKNAEKGSKLEKDLEKLQADLTTTQRRAEFGEEAPAELSNLKAAWTLATSDNLFDSQGHADWAELKKRYPELFAPAKKIPTGNAGSGSSSPGTAPNMNSLIRRAAGRG